ncbi:MAG: hypothetical protein JEY71_11365 [Sphaerochaeta sp.]|nr:hypothetical protein [Sphaerochaeta sp.]
MTHKLTAWILMCIALFCCGTLYAQEQEPVDEASLFSFDEEVLFGDEFGGIEYIEESETGTAVRNFLTTEKVRIGGIYTGSLTPSWMWKDLDSPSFDLFSADSSLGVDLGVKVFFDARPDEETRFYGAVKSSWPFAENTSLFELFADRSWNDQLFFRFGKHTVKWGVGYFWSPADVINISQIDVSDPTAQREGPISLRLHVPILKTQQNIWAYALLDEKSSSGIPSPEDIALAFKYEFLLDTYEIGIGTFYQHGKAPKAMVTATGSVWRLNVFGEVVLGWGSDKYWVDSLESGVSTSQDDEGLYVSLTAGFSYQDTPNNISCMFQYFYNGEGYSFGKRENLLGSDADVLTLNSAIPTDTEELEALSGLLYQSGMHYIGIYMGKDKLFSEKVSVGLLSITNLMDLSGILQPSVSYTFFEGFTASLTPSFAWSTDLLWGMGDYGEYVLLYGGPSVTVGFKIGLGSGNF